MILIVGPAFSGKREYAQSLLSERANLWTRAGLKQGGLLLRDREAFRREILTEVQEMVSEKMDQAALDALADSLCEKASILTASETGAGIVPIDGTLRRKREVQGRFLTLLAQRADCVVRVFYGLPEVIKGSLE